MGKFISGIANKNNLKAWGDYAQQNSFDQSASKAQSRRDLGTAKNDLTNDYTPLRKGKD